MLNWIYLISFQNLTKIVLSITLSYEVFKISIIYLNYENNIILDIKSNLDETGRSFLLTIVNPHNMEESKNNLIKNPCKVKNIDHDKLKYDFVDCLANNNISSKDMFSYEFIKVFQRNINYSSIIKYKFTAFQYSQDLIKLFNKFYFNVYITTEVIGNKLDKKDNSFLKFSFPKFETTELILNFYNTLNSDEFNQNPWSFLMNSKEIILVAKTIHQYQKSPYGNCSDYQEPILNSTNQRRCYRQCIKTLAQKKFNCNPVFIENILYELDSDSYLFCNSSVQRKFDEYFHTKKPSSICNKICPKNCLNIDFLKNVIAIPKGFESNNLKQIYHKTLVWDTTQPMFVYKEVPVLSFIEYLVHLGGLVGLWFGTSAKDVITILFDKTFWFNLWHIFINKFNSNGNLIIVRQYHDL